MNRQCLKTTIATVSLIVGGLMSGCANSAEGPESTDPRQVVEPGDVKVLSPQAVSELGFSSGELAVAFTVDKKGNIQTLVPKDNNVSKVSLPLSAGYIEKLETITLFKTTNPKICWKVFGTEICVSW